MGLSRIPICGLEVNGKSDRFVIRFHKGNVRIIILMFGKHDLIAIDSSKRQNLWK